MQTIDAIDRHELETEPALTIGKLFQDKAMIKTVVTASIGLVASCGVTVADGVADQLVTLVWFTSLIITAVIAQAEARQRAKQQAQETRGHVYAPATVAQERDVAFRKGFDKATQELPLTLEQRRRATNESGPTTNPGS